ncbi:clan AA aspartic protease [Candidatus Sodalis endolongispinus]|uniref:Clan AA aspartic protease n=1 Tax=Candidatus Sodalis endolongispinus TaxID=2812662 RepID=A0ABS5YBJ3_9GAMM|nr:retropepsin-like aspartic protease [Candidatus Sodalis endolongispinus]MBT9431486.1 clan AA aspartic protease [Candidatus Sodalis endolongispinus]
MDSRYAFRPLWASLAVLLAVMPCAPTFAAQASVENPPVLNEPVHLLHMVVPVTIAGNTYRFVLDTGASYTVIDKRLAQTLTRPATSNEIPSVFRTIMANGVVSTQGKLSADQVTLRRSLPITLGNYTLTGVNPWLAIDLDIFSQSLGEKVDGVLGVEVFRQLSWAVDNRSHRLTAWRHSPSLMGYQQFLPYEDQFGRSPVLTLDYKAYTISMVVDTGAVQSFVSEDLIGRMKKQYCNVTTSYRQSPSATASGMGHDNDYLIDGLTFNVI